MKEIIDTLPLYAWTFGATPGFAAVAGVAAAFDGTQAVWWGTSQAWATGLCRTGGVNHFVTSGTEIVDGMGPCIVMSNHESFLDPPFLIRSFARPLSFLVKMELRKFPVFGWSLERLGHVFIDRKDRQRAFESIDKAADEVNKDRAVLIFPEGTRADSDDLLPFKKGGFVLAIKSGAPIVPVGIGGTRAVLPRGNWVKRRNAKIALVVGEPIPTSGYTLDGKGALMALVRERILALRVEARALAEQRV